VSFLQESASKAPKPISQLPTDIIQCIFDAIKSFEDGPDSALDQQKIWIILSLVCKDWAKMTIPYRNLLILPTPRSVKRYIAHHPKLEASGIVTRHLRVNDASIPEDILLKLVPLVSRGLTSLSISSAALQTRYLHDLIKSEHCNLQEIHVMGYDHSSPPTPFITSGDWWKQAYRLHRIDTLTELKLSDIIFYGAFREFQASVLSPIGTLQLQNVYFSSKTAIEHLAWPLVYTLRNVTLINVGVTLENKLSVAGQLCRIVGTKLLSLRIVNKMSYRAGLWGQLSSILPVLESLEVESEFFFKDCGDLKDTPYNLELPQTLKHCKIGPLDWETASAFIKRKIDPDYLPHLQSIPIIHLYPNDKARHQKEVDENNADLIAIESGRRVFKSFELR
jgi:hypothetical protein